MGISYSNMNMNIYVRHTFFPVRHGYMIKRKEYTKKAYFVKTA